ncbi:MAG TPA: integrase family protein [Methylophilaceae bacterium]|nr:integrase family protein [Methylophilaceae bacterium]
MSDKLTKSFVDKIPYPDAGQVFYRDSELKGFGLRVGSGSKVYYAEAKIDRKTIRVTIGRHGLYAPEQARNEAKSILGMLSRGVNPNDADKARRAKSITLAEVHEAYLQARNSLKPRTIYDYNRFAKTHFEDWQGKPLAEISKDMIERKHRQIGERSEAQANLAMRYMRAIFNFALGQYEDSQGNPIIADNPVKRISQTRSWYRVERRQTVIKPHDLPAWFKAVNELPTYSNGANRWAVKDYLLLIIFTGLRREEGLALQWRDVDFRAKTLTIPDPKNRQAHTLPLSDFLYDLLKRRSDDNHEKNPFVFAGTGIKGYMDDPNKQMKIVVEKSGVIFTPHDLRRTFITIAESLDIASYALKRLLNHKMANDVTAGYIINDPERLRIPMQRITDYLIENMKEDQINN